jgi:hypothetical protein
MPDQAIAGSGGAAGAAFVLADDRNHFVRLEHVGEPLARRVGQHLARVLQHAGAADDPAARHVEPDVEAAEVVVELRRPEIQARVPSAQVVVLRDARVPLRRLEQRVADPLRHAMAAAVGPARQLRVPRDLDLRHGLRRHRRRQRHARDRLIEARRRQAPRPIRSTSAFAATTTAAAAPGAREIHGVAVDAEARHDHAVGVLGGKRRASRDQAPEDVVIEAQDDLGELLRALVVQRDGLVAGDGLRLGIELRVDGVVGLQLPVVRARPSRLVARARLPGAPDRVGHRHVAADGARRRRRHRRGLLPLKGDRAQ